MYVDYNDYRKRALLSPLIVEGVVLKKVYHRNPEAAVHTEYFVKIDETHNDELGLCLDTVKLLTYSGFTHDGSYVTTAHSISYFIGEKVILYLYPLSLKAKGIVKIMNNEDEINSYFQKTYNIPFSEINKYALVSKKFNIRNGICFQ